MGHQGLWRLVLERVGSLDGGWGSLGGADAGEVMGLVRGAGELGDAPGFGAFEAEVGGVIDVDEEAFAAVEEAEAEEIILEEGDAG